MVSFGPDLNQHMDVRVLEVISRNVHPNSFPFEAFSTILSATVLSRLNSSWIALTASAVFIWEALLKGYAQLSKSSNSLSTLGLTVGYLIFDKVFKSAEKIISPIFGGTAIPTCLLTLS